MAQKPDISTKKLSFWDQYKDKTPDVALEAIYAHVEAASTMMCGWYWASVRVKRWTSLLVSAVALRQA